MSYTFKKITDTETLEKAPDGATVVCEVDGEIKRVPATGMEGGIKVANIRAVPDENSGMTFSCDNMTYEEAVDYLTNGTPLMFYLSSADFAMLALSVGFESDRILIYLPVEGEKIYWTSSGISTSSPSGGVS